MRNRRRRQENPTLYITRNSKLSVNTMNERGGTPCTSYIYLHAVSQHINERTNNCYVYEHVYSKALIIASSHYQPSTVSAGKVIIGSLRVS